MEYGNEMSPEVESSPAVYEVHRYRAASDGRLYTGFYKRMVDLLFAAVGLIVASPVMALVTLAIVLESGGPVIFRQERLGLGGRNFQILKFRSMRGNAEANGPMWAEKDDCRTTKVGRFLRKSHLDELPQLLNILKGDMTIVGPRPERPYFYDKFEKYIPDFGCRLNVKPGLTGLAQVNGGYDISPARKLSYDKAYMKRITFWTDCRIVFRTAQIVLMGKGAR